MIRRIIQINEEKCNGCGACAAACHEGAIGMVNGKAKLLRDDYCDGLGDCLPTCPTDAITFVEREAAPYDQAAVKENMAAKAKSQDSPWGCAGASASCAGASASSPGASASCPGASASSPGASASSPGASASCPGAAAKALHPQYAQAASPQIPSQLPNWPVQIKLAPLRAGYFDGADLLIAADCSAYAYAAFHRDFIAGRITLIGCPKLDGVDYAEKLAEIFRQNHIGSITITRMEVPCCGGLEMAVKRAAEASGKNLQLRVVTISTDGDII